MILYKGADQSAGMCMGVAFLVCIPRIQVFSHGDPYDLGQSVSPTQFLVCYIQLYKYSYNRLLCIRFKLKYGQYFKIWALYCLVEQDTLWSLLCTGSIQKHARHGILVFIAFA